MMTGIRSADSAILTDRECLVDVTLAQDRSKRRNMERKATKLIVGLVQDDVMSDSFLFRCRL
jgi:hypothetical protein